MATARERGLLVGCYTLDCYCEHCQNQKVRYRLVQGDYLTNSFIGRTRASCMRLARKEGWYVTVQHVSCPFCNPKSELYDAQETA